MVWAAALLTCFAGVAPAFAQDKPATPKDRPAPSLGDEIKRFPSKTPQEELASFKLRHGFALQLAASEPAVSDPVDASFDADGRMFVAEMHGYPYSPEKRPQQPEGGGKLDDGIVRLLEDRDGDGRYEKSVVFADRISWPTSVCCSMGGVYVIAPPHLWFFKDTDGDDRADVREIVFSGFSRSNVQGLANNLKWGLDNKLWAAGGPNGATLAHRGQPLTELGRRDFRFDPRSERLEPVTGGLQFGHSFDDLGRRFVCSNSVHVLHVVYDAQHIDRNPFVAVANPVRSIAVEGGAAPVFRASEPEPWRVVRTRRRAADPAFATRLPQSELVPVGFFTSATGVTVYRGDAYPAEFRGNVFVGDVGGNLVHRKTLAPAGASFSAKRADEGAEFLTSTDSWFRPVNFVNAPDGTLYVLDMYRETIEHPVSIPEDIKKFLDLESGHDKGRIWRLVGPDGKRAPVPRLSQASTADLVKQLESTNAWNRDTAQRLLWERQDRAAVPALETLARNSHSALARVHALHALEGLASLSEAVLVESLRHPDAGVREHALGLAEPRLGTDGALVGAALALVSDPVPRIRWLTALALGEAKSPDAQRALRGLYATAGGDKDLSTACLLSMGSSAAEHARALLSEIRSEPAAARGAAESKTRRALFAEFCKLVGSRADDDAARALLRDVLASQQPGSEVALVGTALRQVGEGLSRRSRTLRTLVSGSPLEQDVARLMDAAQATSNKPDAALSERVEAAALLGLGEREAVLLGLVDPRQPLELQVAAVRAWGPVGTAEGTDRLLHAWNGLSPAVRTEVLEAVLLKAAGTGRLLTAVSEGRFRRADVPRDRQQLLLNHPQDAVRQQARKVLGEPASGTRAQVVAAHKAAAELGGDVARGQMLFGKKCSTCHRVGSVGFAVAPDLSTARNKSPDDLLIAILDPNREFQPAFTVYTAVTQAGRIHTGIVAAETGSTLVLRRAEAKEDVLLRAELDEFKSNGTSLMPEGFEKDLDDQALADLIAFVRSIAPEKKQP